MKCAYRLCPVLDKLVFDGVYRRAGARPRRWVPVLNGCHSTKISKIDTFRRGQAPALRYIHSDGTNLQIPIYRGAEKTDMHILF